MSLNWPSFGDTQWKTIGTHNLIHRAFHHLIPLVCLRITTPDDYILNLQRLPNPDAGNKTIFLQHGLFGSSARFLVGPPHQVGIIFVISVCIIRHFVLSPWLTSSTTSDTTCGWATQEVRHCYYHVVLSKYWYS